MRRFRFTLRDLMAGSILLTILIAVSVRLVLWAQLKERETRAVAALRTIITAQCTFRQMDWDRNTISDYWCADLSGLHRLEDFKGKPINLIAQELARADDCKLSRGRAIGGADLIFPGPPGLHVRTAGLLALPQTQACLGYLFRAIPGYESDPDENGQAWTNTGQFAIQARPERYGVSGLLTFLLTEYGDVLAKDLSGNAPGTAESWHQQVRREGLPMLGWEKRQ